MSSTQITPDTPLSPPPPGVKSNFDNPESNSYQLFIVQGISWAFVFPAFAIRCYTRLRISKNWGVDDYILTLGFLLTTALCSLGIQQSTEYYGKHAWDVRLIDTIKGALVLETLIGLNLYVWSSWLIRLSILMLYRRLFSNMAGIRKVIYIVMALLTGYNLAAWIVVLVSGIPAVGPHGGPSDMPHYLNFIRLAKIMSYFHSGCNIAADLILIAIPLKPVLSLKMSPKKKVAISAIFLTGIAATITAIIGIYFRVKFDGIDPTWHNTSATICWFVELNVGIVVACAPMLAKFFRKIYVDKYKGESTTDDFEDGRDIGDAAWGTQFWHWFAGSKLCSGDRTGRFSPENAPMPYESSARHTETTTGNRTETASGTGTGGATTFDHEAQHGSDQEHSGKSDKGSSSGDSARGR